MKKIMHLFIGSLIFIIILFATNENSIVVATSISDALNKSTTSAGDMSEATQSLTAIVYLIMSLGGFWIVSMLVWGGMTLAGSGGNPQKRTEGFVKLGLTVVGAFIIYKSYDLAAWVTSF